MAIYTKLLREKALGVFLMVAAGSMWALPASPGNGADFLPYASPTITPTPQASPTQPSTVKPPTQGPTLESLQAKIRTRLLTADVARGRVGIKIVSLGSG